ncbi:CopD family protein [Hydrogenophaga sp.]|uniref:CopD family protein n=1 Tax=Hydrogenophaga sp. TaxID=1904254 RepID=UPI00261B7E1D|nr:CopD family protein [Hydrogenophaga sp.]MCW5655281.1 CopD family protein [Hydrogenophaga sp.]
MIYAALKLVHILAIVLWVGGMAFAHFCLRPSVQPLEPPVRLRLLRDVMRRFFALVLWASMITLGTGLWMIGRAAKETVRAGLGFNMPLDWTIMATLGIVMILIFGHIRFALFKRLNRAVEAGDWPAGGAAMASIRAWVFANLCIGVVIIAVALLMT